MQSSTNYKFYHIDSIQNIDQNTWESIHPSFYYEHGWFRIYENLKQFQCEYLLVMKEEKLVAIVPYYIDCDENNILRTFLKPLNKVTSVFNLSMKKILICGAPFCFDSQILVNTVHEEDTLLFRMILQQIEDITRKRLLSFFIFPYVSFNSSFMNILGKSMYKTFFLSTTYLDINFTNFEGYLSSLNKNSRKSIRKDMVTLINSKIHIEKLHNASKYAILISKMYNNTYRKYHKQNSIITPGFVKLLLKNFQEAQVFIASKDNQFQSFNLFFHKNREIYSFKNGSINPSIKNCIYFNLVFYNTINYALENNVRRVHFGPASYQAKITRGCKLEERYLFIKSTNSCFNLGLAYIVKKLNQHSFNYFQKNYFSI